MLYLIYFNVTNDVTDTDNVIYSILLVEGSCTHCPSSIRHAGVDPQHTLPCQISPGSVHPVVPVRQNPQILPNFQLHHSVVAPPSRSARMLNADAQLNTFQYPTVSKPFPYSNALMAISRSQLYRSKSVTDKKPNSELFHFQWG